jgi:hypothetical protein
VAKLSADGDQLLWSTFVGDAGRTFVRDMALAPDGSVVLAIAGSADFPHVTNGSYQTLPAGGDDGVIVKLSSDAQSVLWGTYLGGSANEWPAPSVRVASDGSVFILGDSTSTNYPTTQGAHDRSHNGGIDLVLSKLSSDGASLLCSTFLGGSKGDFTETHGLQIDSAGDVFIGASTTSGDYPTTEGAYQETYAGSGGPGTGRYTNYPGDAVISKLSGSDCSLLASTFLGGSLGEGIEGVGVVSNTVVVSGSTYSANFPTVAGQQSKKGLSNDFFIAQLSDDLDQLFLSTFVGGDGSDAGRALAVSPVRVVAAGASDSTDFPAIAALQASLSGARDGAVIAVALESTAAPPVPSVGIAGRAALGLGLALAALAVRRRRTNVR